MAADCMRYHCSETTRACAAQLWMYWPHWTPESPYLSNTTLLVQSL